MATTSTKNGTAQPTIGTTQSYAWYDGAVLSQVAYSVTGQSTKYTTYTNAASGVLRSAYVGDGRARTITVTSDALGQAVRRDEADGNAWNGTTLQGGDPHEAWYRFDGRQTGYTGNDGTYDTSYAGSLDDRTHTVFGGTGAFRYGGTTGAAGNPGSTVIAETGYLIVSVAWCGLPLDGRLVPEEDSQSPTSRLILLDSSASLTCHIPSEIPSLAISVAVRCPFKGAGR